MSLPRKSLNTQAIESLPDPSSGAPVQVTPIDLAYALPGGLARLASKGKWEYAKHLELLEDKLLDIASGKEMRLLVSVPPRHGKSMFLSQFGSAWFLGRFPEKKILLISYQADFAKSWGRKARDVLTIHGEEVFDVRISDEKSAANNWGFVGHEGGMETAGMGGSITGKGADLLIIDDPIKGRAEALNIKLLEEQWDWFGSDVYSRLEPGASMIIIQTRWNEEDLIGMNIKDMKDGGEVWDIVSFPAYAEESDILGREEGDVLWPERWSKFALERKRSKMTDHWWQATHQQNPRPAGGYLIKSEWFRRFGTAPEHPDLVVLSFDTAQKEKEINDYTVIGVWFVMEHGYYLTHVVRDRMDHPRLITVAKNMIAKNKPNAILIEDKASGTSLIQHLQKETTAAIVPIMPILDKVMRMDSETPSIEAGNLYLPEAGSAPWLSDFEDELLTFPNSARKDQVDMLSQFLKWMRERDFGIDMF